MLPAVREDIKVEGDLGGQVIKMKFDQNSIAHIMTLLTDLYSNPELAVVREISVNALDSHIEAGQTRPIEVTVPSSFNQYFKVKDYGVGLNTEDIQNVYSLYGASTKRETNALTGSLGLGCKSPLTYTSSFTVTGIKDGVKTQVAVSREIDGTGVMTVVDITDTDEPNGVEVIIPTKNYNNFDFYCREFFKFWPQGSVLVNDKEPEHFSGQEICPGTYMTDFDTDYVVMGHVAYPIKSSYFGYDHNYKLLTFVKMGTVQFTPSREELMYTPLTERTLTLAKETADAAILQRITDDIANATSYSGALKAYYDWKKLYKHKYAITQFEYQGEKLPGRFDIPVIIYSPEKYTRKTTETDRNVAYPVLEDALLVHNFTPKNLTSVHKAKLNKYVEDNDIDVKRFVISDERIGSPWTDDIPMVDWDVIKVIKISRGYTNTGGPRAPASYDVLNKYGNYNEILKTDLPKTDLLYFSGSEFDKDTKPKLYNVFPHATIVKLGQNRWDAFKRSYPNARHVKDAFSDLVDTLVLTNEDLYHMSYHSWTYSNWDHTKFNDPAVAEYIRLGHNTETENSQIAQTMKRIEYYMGSKRIKFDKYESPMDRYPLIQNNYNEADAIIYINAKYEMEQANESKV